MSFANIGYILGLQYVSRRNSRHRFTIVHWRILWGQRSWWTFPSAPWVEPCWCQDEDEPATQALDEDDVVIMRTYGLEAKLAIFALLNNAWSFFTLYSIYSNTAVPINIGGTRGVGPYVEPIKVAENPGSKKSICLKARSQIFWRSSCSHAMIGFESISRVGCPELVVLRKEAKEYISKINKLIGVKESGLA